MSSPKIGSGKEKPVDTSAGNPTINKETQASTKEVLIRTSSTERAELAVSSLIEVARHYLFVREDDGRPNRSRWIDFFNKSAGAAIGSPWCASWIYHILLENFERKGYRSLLRIHPSVLHTWNDNKEFQTDDCRKGRVAIWQFGSSANGHMELVVDDSHPVTFKSLGGNTSDGIGVVREGTGVFLRDRVRRSDGQMKLLGFMAAY